MPVDDLLTRLALALGIGLLIGLERGWKNRDEDAGQRTAGIRTFALSGLLGGAFGAIADALGETGGAVVIGLAFVTHAAVIAMFSREENRADGTFSATMAVAAMVTFALGSYAVIGNAPVAAAAAVAAAVLLAIREELHGLVAKITWTELRSALVLLAMTFIALPVVPDDPIGPYGGVNPREVWLIAIVLAGVSFLGYAAVKYLGTRHGVLLAAAAGGLVSSTAVALSSAHRAAKGEGSPRLLAAGVALATAISFLRVLAIVAALNAALLAALGPPLGAAAAAAVIFALLSVFRRKRSDGQQETSGFRNPFSFWSVVGFAAFLALILVIGRAATELFGATGAVIGATLIGFADVDAVAVSIADLVPGGLDAVSATIAILAAVASNTATKVVMGAVIGRGAFAVALAVMSAACVAAAGLGWWAGALVRG